MTTNQEVHTHMSDIDNKVVQFKERMRKKEATDEDAPEAINIEAEGVTADKPQELTKEKLAQAQQEEKMRKAIAEYQAKTTDEKILINLENNNRLLHDLCNICHQGFGMLSQARRGPSKNVVKGAR